MADIKIGDKVRIKDRQDWPSPPGYIFTNAEGTVIKWIEDEEAIKGFPGFVFVRLDKAEGAAEAYLGKSNSRFFLAENLEKL